MDKYTPIPCEIYGNYELAILRRSHMRICWLGRRRQLRLDSAVPVNIRTRKHGEFLVIRNRAGTCIVIRLDRILRIDTLYRKSRTVKKLPA